MQSLTISISKIQSKGFLNTETRLSKMTDQDYGGKYYDSLQNHHIASK